ncbi:hypothetical protein EVAR_4194_1 [Eumeta japonica]|uniref:Uncharacterized protein n=1 Tax=Eumeta variegata TaxID=151549 RepID=A0A4C1TJ63_EUMVA|nr:hypothetical protein EVAR_4194_1 [Eumeta japonica]
MLAYFITGIFLQYLKSLDPVVWGLCVDISDGPVRSFIFINRRSRALKPPRRPTKGWWLVTTVVCGTATKTDGLTPSGARGVFYDLT